MTVAKYHWVGVATVCGMLVVGGVWAIGQGPGVGQVTGQPAVGARPAIAGEGKRDESVARKSGSAQRLKSLGNLKQIMLAIHNYHDAYNFLPSDIRDKDGKPLLSWRVAILPFLEQDALYRQFKLDEPWDSEHNKKLLAKMPNAYHVGFAGNDLHDTYYQVFAGPNTPLHAMNAVAGGAPGGPAGPGIGGIRPVPAPGAQAGGGNRIADITDGTSFTLGVAEMAPAVPWTKPADVPFDPKKPVKLVLLFSNEWHVAMMDGSAHALKPDIDQQILRRLIMMNDGEPQPPMDQLHAPTLAETPAEKAELKKLIDENRRVIDQISDLLKEHVDLLAEQNGRMGDLGAAAELADRLKGIAQDLRDRNTALRDKSRGKPAAPAPTEKGPGN
jgi:hypothetical protein